mmetsp:Transcript_8959/g.16135  ORF Transcript_8959/g.16135 Transcript_8959/m.16135 type:complete len:121 (-) Transcript_8959:150-512(-)
MVWAAGEAPAAAPRTPLVDDRQALLTATGVAVGSAAVVVPRGLWNKVSLAACLLPVQLDAGLLDITAAAGAAVEDRSTGGCTAEVVECRMELCVIWAGAGATHGTGCKGPGGPTKDCPTR